MNMANTSNVGPEALDLANIRTTLCRMEDSIIFSLIERAQYPINPEVYQADSPLLSEFVRHQLRTSGSNGCYADRFLYRTECLHAEAGRYIHPTEHSFFAPLPDPLIGDSHLQASSSEPLLYPHKVNINQKLLDLYRTKIVPEICAEGGDSNLGSVSTTDIQVLQTIATRIYYGLFVAESKLRSERERFNKLISERDTDGIMAAITKPEVEKRNIRRVIKKCETFSQEVTVDDSNAPPAKRAKVSDAAAAYKVTPEFVGSVFEKFIMPLTREVEVDYLLNYVPVVADAK